MKRISRNYARALASLRRRLEAVNAEIRRLREENRQLRDQLAIALGEQRAARPHGHTDDHADPKHNRSATVGPCS